MICREFIANKMSNERFRQLLGADPVAFWGASLRLCGYELVNDTCRDEWLRYTWQKQGNLNHEDLAEAIRQAEDEISRTLGHPIGGEWICERHDLSKCVNGKVKLNLPYATAFGSRNTRMLGEVSLTDVYPSTKIQPHEAVHHSEYQMTWETAELFPWRISINGTEYDLSPTGLNIATSKSDLQRWLNSLGLGNWYVNTQDPIEVFTETDYNGAPIPTIEIPDGVTVEYLITYSHAEAYRKRISWDYDGHVIDGVWYDTQTMVFADVFAIDTWADGLGLGNWGVFGCLTGDITNDPPVLLIPDKPATFDVYGSTDITSLQTIYYDKLVIDGVFYDNTALITDVAINNFLVGLGLNLTLGYITGTNIRIINNPDLVVIHKVTIADYSPLELFGLIKDEFISPSTNRPFSYYLEDTDTDGYYENGVILGIDSSVAKPCELQVYAVSTRTNGEPNKLCRIRPIEVKTLNSLGSFEIHIPTHLLIKNELLDQRPKPYNDPFPIDLCCASDDVGCDPQSFYVDHLEVWRVWHDDTQPGVIYRSNNNCGFNTSCRSIDDSGCANVALSSTRWFKPSKSVYKTVNIPDRVGYPDEMDAWGGGSCTVNNAKVIDVHYYFDPCDSSCHEVNCTGDICSKFERAVFMLAAARLWDLCPCGCDDGRLKTFQRERGGQFQAHSYDGTMQVMSTGGSKSSELLQYPYGMRYGEVESWRLIKQYLRFEKKIGAGLI